MPKSLSPLVRASLKSVLGTLYAPFDHDIDCDYALDQLEKDIFGAHLRWDERWQLIVILRLLASGPGTALLFATASLQPFTSRSACERERLFLSLGTSRLELHRRTFNGIKRLCLAVAASAMVPGKTRAGPATNPLWASAGYPGPAAVARTVPAKLPDFVGARTRELLQQAAAAAATTSSDGGGSGAATLECDVVIVGSGAGGGVAAAILARSGLKVVVLEKGRYVPPHEIRGSEHEAFGSLYEKGGLLTTDDGAIPILAGATLGGGTTINWGCCLPPQDYVRREWAGRRHGLKQFGVKSRAFDDSIAAVLSRIGGDDQSKVQHNPSNAALLAGADKLGYARRITGQSFKDPAAPSAGWSCFGDRGANKQGVLATFLSDAVAAGARVVDRCTVDRVLFEDTGTVERCSRRAVGVVAQLASGDDDGGAVSSLRVHASRCVVLSAGSLHSPCVLLRSGAGGSHVGKHLRLHPVTGVVGRFPHEMKLYEGAPMTAVCDVAEVCPQGTYYGAKLEIPSCHPGLMAAALGWRGGRAFADDVSALNRTSAAIVLQRDGGEGGTISLNAARTGPVPHYRVRAADQASILAALEHAVRVFVAAGAEEVSTLHTGMPTHTVVASERRRAAPGESPALEAWLAGLRKRGLPRNGVGVFSAHQMGTCRMGVDASKSVVTGDGEVWDADGLFVFDASVFPTASGANPMVTTLAISHLLSTRLAARLGKAAGEASAGEKAAGETVAGETAAGETAAGEKAAGDGSEDCQVGIGEPADAETARRRHAHHVGLRRAETYRYENYTMLAAFLLTTALAFLIAPASYTQGPPDSSLEYVLHGHGHGIEKRPTPVVLMGDDRVSDTPRTVKYTPL